MTRPTLSWLSCFLTAAFVALLAGCTSFQPGPMAAAVTGVSAVALAWLDSLLAQGVIEPAQWETGRSALIAIDTTMSSLRDGVAAANKAASEAVQKQWTPQEVGAGLAATAAAAAAIVQKVRGPSATPDERRARKVAKAG